MTEQSYDRHFDVNAKGSFFTVQRLAPLVADGGAFVFTTVANDRVFPGMSAYSGSKEALRAFARQGDELTPLRRNGTAEEVAAAALFLPSTPPSPPASNCRSTVDSRRGSPAERSRAGAPLG